PIATKVVNRIGPTSAGIRLSVLAMLAGTGSINDITASAANCSNFRGSSGCRPGCLLHEEWRPGCGIRHGSSLRRFCPLPQDAAVGPAFGGYHRRATAWNKVATAVD